jgi:hypothetical protein
MIFYTTTVAYGKQPSTTQQEQTWVIPNAITSSFSRLPRSKRKANQQKKQWETAGKDTPKRGKPTNTAGQDQN